MAEYIEGKHAVFEALHAHAPIREIVLADNLKHDKSVSDIVKLAKRAGITVRTMSRKELDARSARGSHQGVMAQTKSFQYSSQKEIIRAAQKQAERSGGAALVVVLDHITDAGNLGAIARSAEIVGASGIIIPNKRAAHVTAATYKSSAGAISNIRIAQVPNIAQCLEALKEAGFWVAGASEHATDGIWDANFTGPMVLVMGSEGSGLSQLTLKTCDFLVKLPQVGKTQSLNVAQAATACMYEWLRQNPGMLQDAAPVEG